MKLQGHGGGKALAEGFDFTGYMCRLCEDIRGRVPRLGHVDMSAVAVSFCQARKAVDHGMHASLTPMRFADGRPHTVRRGRKWSAERLYDKSGREILYILSFYLPRFLNLGFHDKLTTVIHELWHIGPRFDGDVRRFGGRCFAHGSSQKQYEVQVHRLADYWLSHDPPGELYRLLRCDFGTLVRRYGSVRGTKIPTPKLIPVD